MRENKPEEKRTKVECWATIENDAERSAVMAWVRASNFHSYAEIEKRVYITYLDDPTDPENNARKWGLIHYIEQYKEHSIVIRAEGGDSNGSQV